MSSSVLQARRELNFADILALRNGWYHSMEFPDGARIEGHMPIELLRERYADLRLPDDLTGKRALDIGAWDGWFSFEMERHGAEVTAVDVVAVPNFQYAHARKRSRVRYIVEDVYNLPRHHLGQFDYTLFLGVLYHVRHPLLALDVVCGLTREMAIVDSFVVNGDERGGDDREHIHSPLPFCEFYETDELGGNLDNWFGPTVDCLLAFCRTAGFVRVRLLSILENHARVACYRHWEPPPGDPAVPAPVLLDAKHNHHGGVRFSSDKEEYLTYWFTCGAAALDKDQVLPEVGEFAAPVLVVSMVEPGVFMANARIPPGLSPGLHTVRLRLADSAFSNERTIFLDTPLSAGQFEIGKVFDGVRWTENRISLSAGGHLSLWVTGLPPAADPISTELYAGIERLALTYLGPELVDGARQLNAQLGTVFQPGRFNLHVRQGIGVSNIVQIEVEP
jgi:tRNA (mo5U34)-methyltransferase